MAPKLLYYASLEKHMDSYMNQVKQTELNEQFQLAQNKIVREGELMNLSQADVMNKLKQLQQDLQNQVAQSIITPLSKTNAPEMIIPKEEYKPMTSNEYESIINKKPKISNVVEKHLEEHLNKLNKKHKVDLTKKEAFNLFYSTLPDDLRESIKDIPQEYIKAKLLKRSQTKRFNPEEIKTVILKKTPKVEKNKDLESKFQQELREKIKNRNKPKNEFPSSSTQATTASTTSNINSPKSSFNLHPAQATAKLRAEFAKAGKTWPYGKGNVSYANMVKAREELGQGLKKKSKKMTK